MEAINLDLNNLFNLSYNFEGLKIFLASIAKNQDLMMGKIKIEQKKKNLILIIQMLNLLMKKIKILISMIKII